MTVSMLVALLFATAVSGGPPVPAPLQMAWATSAAGAAAQIRTVLPTAPVHQSRDSLTLEEAIRIALERNARVAASRRELEAADERRRVASANRYPSLDVSGFLSRYTADQRLLPPSATGQPMIYARQASGADLSLDVPLFLGGRLTEQLRAEEETREVYAQRLQWAGEELKYHVAAAFFAILRQLRVVESVRFSVGALETHERIVTEMMEAGKAARVDVLRTQVRLADLRQRLLVEDNALQVQRQVLAYLMGEDDPDSLVPLRGTLDLAPFQEDAEVGLARALARRPDLEAIRAVRSAQEHQVGVAGAARWPALYLRGSFTTRWAIAPQDRPPGADASPTLGFIGLAVSLPLFDGGLVSARVAEERALLAAAEERVRDVEALVRLEVDEAVLGVRSGRGRVEATETSIQQARETLRIEQEKYRLGKGSITDVLDAQSELLAAETAYYGALAEYNTAIARYRLVTGEGVAWEPEL